MFYKAVRLILWVFFKILFRFKRVGQENIPAEGPVIIASNHVSYLDPIIVAIASPRPVSFMAKAELFRKPLLGRAISKLNAFPVQREKADVDAIKAALRVLRKGEVLGLFPEGTRIRNGSLGEAEPGVARLAMKSGAVVVPMAIKGTFHAFPGKPIRALVGKPLFPHHSENPKEDAEQFAKETMRAIRNLISQEEKK